MENKICFTFSVDNKPTNNYYHITKNCLDALFNSINSVLKSKMSTKTQTFYEVSYLGIKGTKIDIFITEEV